MRGTTIALLAGLALAGTALTGCQVILGLQDPEVAPADAGPDALVCPDPCDLVSDCGCAGGTCSWDVVGKTSYCRQTAGAVDRQGACSADSDCLEGLSCIYGVCRSYCAMDSDCPFRTFCTADFTPTVPTLTCSDRCDAGNNLGCPSTQSCIAIQGTNSATCVPFGTIQTGNNCGSNVFGCVKGDVCYVSGSTLICRQLCSLSAGGSDCTNSSTCNNPGDLSEDDQPIGICS
jgi:hypothetical protein